MVIQQIPVQILALCQGETSNEKRIAFVQENRTLLMQLESVLRRRKILQSIAVEN